MKKSHIFKPSLLLMLNSDKVKLIVTNSETMSKCLTVCKTKFKVTKYLGLNISKM